MSCKNNVSRGCCFKKNEANGDLSATYKSGCQKMDVYDWLGDVENPMAKNDIYEIQFKNTRKGYYLNENKDVTYQKGDVVVVESAPGYNVGIVTMCSDLVSRQMRKKGFSVNGCEFMKILRYSNSIDIQRWEEAIAMEHGTMIRSRQICTQLNLDMKIGDVEYQADKMKAIFYYIADGRVDFRELIKVLAEQFRVRIEMKQIGSRQEAGLIGGLAACGRELCCSTWQTNFRTVVIGAARVQDISPNPQKLAGQCGKLKCCLNYELDSYLDARERLPKVYQPLETLQANYFLVKTDVLRGILYFSADPKNPAVQIPLTSERVRHIQGLNKKGQKIDDIRTMVETVEVVAEPEFENVVGQDSLTRFDKSKSKNRRKNNNRGGERSNEQRGSSQNSQQNGQQGESRSGEQPNEQPNEQRGGEARGERRDNRNNNRRNDRPQGEQPNAAQQGGQRSGEQQGSPQNSQQNGQQGGPRSGEQRENRNNNRNRNRNNRDGARKEGGENRNNETGARQGGENRNPNSVGSENRSSNQPKSNPSNE